MNQLQKIIGILKVSERNDGNYFCHICGNDEVPTDFNFDGDDFEYHFNDEICLDCFKKIDQLNNKLT